MADRLHFGGARDGSHIRQNSRAGCVGRGNGRVRQILERSDSVLRRLSNEVVVHTILPVEEEHGGYLKTSAQGIQNAGDHTPLVQPALPGFRAIDVNVVGRIVKLLLYA